MIKVLLLFVFLLVTSGCAHGEAEDLSSSLNNYTEIELPNDFYRLDFNLFRNQDGKVITDIDIETHWGNHFDQNLYIDSLSGSNSTGNGTYERPYSTVSKAVETIVDSSLERFKIIIQGDLVLLNEFNLDSKDLIEFNNKHVVIEPEHDGKVNVLQGWSSERGVITKKENGDWFRGEPLSWTHKKGNVYKTKRKNTLYVLDLEHKDENGNKLKLNNVNSLKETKSTPNSVFIDGEKVYVHTLDGNPPDGNIGLVAIYNEQAIGFKLNNSTVILNKLDFFNHRGLLVEGDINSTFVLNESEIGKSNFTNGLNIRNVKESYILNTSVHDSLRDGFNYHYHDIPSDQRREVFVFEYNTQSIDNGLRDSNENNNATSAHGGVNTLRVNSYNRTSRGPIVADVNGGYSILIDTQSNDSVLTNNRGNSYQFTTDEGSTPAKAVLINSGGTSPNLSIITDKPTELILEDWIGELDKISDTF